MEGWVLLNTNIILVDEREWSSLTAMRGPRSEVGGLLLYFFSSVVVMIDDGGDVVGAPLHPWRRRANDDDDDDDDDDIMTRMQLRLYGLRSMVAAMLP